MAARLNPYPVPKGYYPPRLKPRGGLFGVIVWPLSRVFNLTSAKAVKAVCAGAWPPWPQSV